MFAYCGNNPVNMTDPNGKSAILFIGAGILGALLGLNIGMELKKTFISDQQKENVKKSIDQVAMDDANMHIPLEPTMQNVDFATYGYYFDELYYSYEAHCHNNNIDEDDMMSQFHIQWEFHWHVIGYMMGFKDPTETVDLTPEETPLDMIHRGVKFLIGD
jgi:hypothetical protein